MDGSPSFVAKLDDVSQEIEHFHKVNYSIGNSILQFLNLILFILVIMTHIVTYLFNND